MLLVFLKVAIESIYYYKKLYRNDLDKDIAENAFLIRSPKEL